MTIKVSKPSINLREKLNELEQDTGLKGQELMRAETVAEARSLIGAGRRNLIINGDFKVSQRGDYTSATTLSGTDVYLLDRWKVTQTTVSGTIQDLGGKIRLKATSSGTGQVRAVQNIETQDLVLGGTYTLSALVKSNKSTAGINVTDDKTSGSGDADIYYAYHTGDGTDQRLSVTFTVRSTVPYEFLVRAALQPAGNASITSGDYIEVSEFQLERGSVATEFEHRSFGEELALCQRYYQKSYNIDTYPAATTTVGSEDFYGSADVTNILVKIYYPVHTRTNTPTIYIYNTNNSTAGQAYVISNSGHSNYNATVNNVATSGFRCYVPRNGTAWEAHRLLFHWIVDDEL